MAKQACSIDQLSGGRLVLGVASGDRPAEFPAYGIDFESRGARFRDSLDLIHRLVRTHGGQADSPLGVVGSANLIPKPAFGRIPMVVTGSARQELGWIAKHADGWLVYPGPTSTAEGPRQLGDKIARWRELVPGEEFRPAATNEWIDLVEDPMHPPTPLRGGHILQTGREGLIELLGRWQDAGINHAALGVQYCIRPRKEVIHELADEVLPHFPSLTPAVAPREPVW